MENTKTIYELHEEHKNWLSKLAFYKDELPVMQNRISEIAKKNSGKEVLSLVDHFQNQLIVQREQIDVLTHQVKTHETSLENAANKRPSAIDSQPFEDHGAQREAMENFELLFGKLRKELDSFLSKWM